MQKRKRNELETQTDNETDIHRDRARDRDRYRHRNKDYIGTKTDRAAFRCAATATHNPRFGFASDNVQSFSDAQRRRTKSRSMKQITGLASNGCELR